MNSINLEAVYSAVYQKGYLIDDQLQVRKKSGFQWIVLLLKRPFYQVMGWDVFEHVRVDHVAQSLLDHYKKNNSTSLETILNIIDALNKKTAFKYQRKVDNVRHILDGLNSVAHLSLKWPLDIEAETQKEVDEEIRTTTREFFLNSKAAEQVRKLHVCFKKKHSLSVNIFISKNKINRVFLIFKKPICGGTERSIKKSFELLQGLECIKKPLKAVESEIYETINSRFPNRVGILPQYYFLYTSQVRVPRSIQVYEKHYPQSLLAVLWNKRLISTKAKLQVIEQLITGLSFFHSLSYNETVKQLEDEGGVVTIKPFQLPFFHKDIKPDNILYTDSTDGVEVRLTDLGFSNTITKIQGTYAYCSRDIWTLLVINNTTDDPQLALRQLIEYYVEFGQRDDIWAMGVVFAGILLNSIEDFFFKDLSNQQFSNYLPPLKSYQEFFTSALAFGRHERSSLPSRKTTQRKINEEIISIKDSLSGSDSAILCSLWDIVGEMLTVKSDQRITAKDAHLKILEIKKLPEFQNIA